jgi:hypothetical protein
MIHDQRLLEQRGTDLFAQENFIHLELADFLALRIENRDFDHGFHSEYKACFGFLIVHRTACLAESPFNQFSCLLIPRRLATAASKFNYS